jgi:hypothetical protein
VGLNVATGPSLLEGMSHAAASDARIYRSHENLSRAVSTATERDFGEENKASGEAVRNAPHLLVGRASKLSRSPRPARAVAAVTVLLGPWLTQLWTKFRPVAPSETFRNVSLAPTAIVNSLLMSEPAESATKMMSLSRILN